MKRKRNGWKNKIFQNLLRMPIQDEIYKAVAIMSRHCFREDSPGVDRRGVMKKKFLFVRYQEVLCSS